MLIQQGTALRGSFSGVRIWVASFPGEASHHLQYEKVGESLVHFITYVSNVKGRKIDFNCTGSWNSNNSEGTSQLTTRT